MLDYNLTLLTIENTKVEIAASEIKSIQGFNGVHTEHIGGMPVVAGGYQYIELKNKEHTYKIARNAENDSKILTFMLETNK